MDQPSDAPDYGISYAAERANAYANAEEADARAILESVARSAAAGDGQALDLLLRLIDDHRLAMRTVRRLIVNDADAEEVGQDVLVAVARGIHRFQGSARFSTWLYSVSRNIAISRLRGRDPDLPTDQLERAGAARRVSSMVAEQQLVRDALATLPDHYRVVVSMRDLERCSYQDIATALDLEINTVKSRINRGRGLLAAAVGVA